MNTKKTSGFTLVEIMIVVAIIGLLAAMAMPSFAKARLVSQQNNCVNNLRQIDSAVDQWAIEENQPPASLATPADLDIYLKRGTAAVTCPADSTDSFAASYTINVLSTPPVCNIVPADHVL